jgi:hypothetical protein
VIPRSLTRVQDKKQVKGRTFPWPSRSRIQLGADEPKLDERWEKFMAKESDIHRNLGREEALISVSVELPCSD